VFCPCRFPNVRSSKSGRFGIHGKAELVAVMHHIFPKKFMQDRDFPVERLNTVANYAILSQTDNAELADRDPFDVWRGMKSNQRECAGRQLCFVASDNLLRRDAYDEFVEFRADKLAERLNVFIGLGT
jgi:hypothetical protein